MANMKLIACTLACQLLKLYILQISLLPTSSLPVNALRKLEERGYILVAGTSSNVSGSSSKVLLLDRAGSNGGECEFNYRFDRETSRIPKIINVAVLKDPNSGMKCQKLT